MLCDLCGERAEYQCMEPECKRQRCYQYDMISEHCVFCSSKWNADEAPQSDDNSQRACYIQDIESLAHLVYSTFRAVSSKIDTAREEVVAITKPKRKPVGDCLDLEDVELDPLDDEEDPIEDSYLRSPTPPRRTITIPSSPRRTVTRLTLKQPSSRSRSPPPQRSYSSSYSSRSLSRSRSPRRAQPEDFHSPTPPGQRTLPVRDRSPMRRPHTPTQPKRYPTHTRNTYTNGYVHRGRGGRPFTSRGRGRFPTRGRYANRGAPVARNPQLDRPLGYGRIVNQV